ncbi:hypothetical protein PAXRUDRAFT_16536 [Paxillus rubicundulus Ve08.2h10]|uniref:Uncharacterized protein n=1 Tax=Paxillus rubicundulus Ve08.2h10 TaxID=930991 RepID=A0A0D0D5X5_9AGAM|nr:hypothetical protein PAXRUDRAFT_16536 [Paxillus rubicundulus Ve08.2h10]
MTPAPGGPLVSPVTAPPSPTSQANLASSFTAHPAASTMSSTAPVPNQPGSAGKGVGAKAMVHSAQGGTKRKYAETVTNPPSTTTSHGSNHVPVPSQRQVTANRIGA